MTTTPAAPTGVTPGLQRITSRRVKVGLVSGGLGAYWPQFPDLLPQLQHSAARVSERLSALDCDVVDVGFISDAQDGARAAEQLRVAGCDLIVGFLTTYMTASMLVPVAQRSGAPVLLINLQPTEAMDHASFDTGQWLAYCGACPLPEMANAFLRCDIPFHSVSGYVEDERAWAKIGRWIKAAGVRGALRHARHGLMGHLYPGMLDVSTDLTLVTANFGGHMEVLEFDDLRVRVNAVTDAQVADRVALAREVFDIAPNRAGRRLRLGGEGVRRSRSPCRGLRPGQPRLLPPRIGGRAARAPRRRDDPGRLTADRPRHPRCLASTSCAPRWRCSSSIGWAAVGRSPSFRR